jgi:ATP-dependent Clp protease ATP-binding subunit ClpA
LYNKRVLSLDLAQVVAGSGIRGQFESKFKALLKDIEEEAGKVICFIDELREHDFPATLGTAVVIGFTLGQICC